MRASCSVVFVFFLASTAVAQTSVTPSYANPRGGEVIHIQAAVPTCVGDCEVVIAFGGVPSPKVTSLGLGAFDAVAPPHAEGAVAIDIFIFRFLPVAHIERQFAYVVQREPVLIPISADGVVGRDALWSTELWVHNDSDQDATMLPIVCTDFIGPHDCGRDPLMVRANSARKLPALGTTPDSIGTLLFPPAELSGQLSYDLRLLDAAHLGAGTALPVVRFSAMQRRKLTMLNVPAGNARARRRLRIQTTGNSDFVVRVYDLDSGRQLSERTLEARLPTDSLGIVITLNDDVYDGTAGGATRLRVEVEETYPPAPDLVAFWAFISATDNVTQQVTVISPQ